MLMASLLMALGASKQNLCHKGDETQLANALARVIRIVLDELSAPIVRA